jgi:transcriptional regulator with XRE-family HTH domain
MTITPTTEQDFAARMECLGVTQEFLARYVGLSQSEVSKLISGVRPQGEGHRKINDALQELEAIAACFAPMKPAFENADAVREWLRSPTLPNLFKLLTDAQLQYLDAAWLTSVSAISSDCERLEAEIAASHQQARDAWLEFLQSWTLRNGQPVHTALAEGTGDLK